MPAIVLAFVSLAATACVAYDPQGSLLLGSRGPAVSLRHALQVEMVWRGLHGEFGEFFLSDGLFRVRVARRERGAQPIFSAAGEARLAKSRLPVLARELERSGIFTLPPLLEDLEGRANSIRIKVRLHGRSLVLRSRQQRAPAIDRLLAILDAELPFQAFASLPNPPASRGRPRLHPDLAEALKVHRTWWRRHPSQDNLLVDIWLLAQEAGDRASLAAIDAELDKRPDVAVFRNSLRRTVSTPLR